MAARILRTADAADYLGLSSSTLEKMRVYGTGPEFVRIGLRSVGYTLEALELWVNARRRRSTSDIGMEAGHGR